MRLIAKRHCPKLWVMVVNAHSLLTDERTAWALAPYITEDPFVRKTVFESLATPIERFRYLSKLARLNKYILLIIKGIIQPPNNAAGFKPLDGHLPEFQEQILPQELDIKDVQIQMLRNMVSTAKELNTEIIFVLSPKYYYNFSPYRKKPEHDIKLMNIYQNLADELGVTLLDHTASGIPEFYDGRFFKDQGHLNRAGNKIISEKLVNDILSEGVLQHNTLN
jgi:hypothetical protein